MYIIPGIQLNVATLGMDNTSAKISIPILYVLNSYLGIEYFFVRIEISIPGIL